MTQRPRVVVSMDLQDPGNNYGDTWAQVDWTGNVRRVLYRGLDGVTESAGVCLEPPEYIVNPLEHFAELIACPVLVMQLSYRVRGPDYDWFMHTRIQVPCNDAALATMFDPLPDPRLVSHVELHCSGGAVRRIHVITATEWEIDFPYSRDVFLAVNQRLWRRTDTRRSLFVQLRRPRESEFGAREERKIVQLLQPITEDCDLHMFPRCAGPPVQIVTNTAQDTIDAFIDVISTPNLCNAHEWEAWCQILSRKTTSTVVRQCVSVPGHLFGVRRAKLWSGRASHQYQLVSGLGLGVCNISWRRVQPVVLSAVIALVPLGLSPYVVVWILQWIESIGAQREVRLLRLVDGVMRSCAELRQTRTKLARTQE